MVTGSGLEVIHSFNHPGRSLFPPGHPTAAVSLSQLRRRRALPSDVERHRGAPPGAQIGRRCPRRRSRREYLLPMLDTHFDSLYVSTRFYHSRGSRYLNFYAGAADNPMSTQECLHDRWSLADLRSCSDRRHRKPNTLTYHTHITLTKYITTN